MYRLYYFPGACSFAPHIVLEEIGKAFELEIVVPASALRGQGGAVPTWKSVPDLSTIEWKSMNPKGRVPALLGVGGASAGAPNLLTEAAAILFFLGLTYPEAQLLPADTTGRARCLEWTNFLATSVHSGSLALVSRPARFVEGEEYFSAVNARGMQNCQDNFRYIDEIFGDGRDWAVPDSYSIADVYLFLYYRSGQGIGIAMEEQFKAWTRHAKRVAARPAVQRVVEREAQALKAAREGNYHPRQTIRPGF